VDRQVAADLPPALQRHYSVAEVAELWSWGETKVREVFRDEPGVGAEIGAVLE
jgi:hypothetical protein